MRLDQLRAWWWYLSQTDAARQIMIGAILGTIAGAVVSADIWIFSLVCTRHDWHTFWRWAFHAGCP